MSRSTSDFSYLQYDTPKAMQRAVKRTNKAIRPLLLKFDTIVAQGYSGAVMAGIMGYMHDKAVTIIRKEEDGEHAHGSTIEGNIQDTRILLLDDFVASGRTLNRLYHTVHVYKSNLVIGVLLYGREDDGVGVLHEGEMLVGDVAELRSGFRLTKAGDRFYTIN